MCLLCAHFVFSETVEDCGSREICEETGLKLKDIKTHCILNVVWLKEQRHFVAVVLRGEVDATEQNEPDTLEPHKCEGTRSRSFFLFHITVSLYKYCGCLKCMQLDLI